MKIIDYLNEINIKRVDQILEYFGIKNGRAFIEEIKNSVYFDQQSLMRAYSMEGCIAFLEPMQSEPYYLDMYYIEDSDEELHSLSELSIEEILGLEITEKDIETYNLNLLLANIFWELFCRTYTEEKEPVAPM